MGVCGTPLLAFLSIRMERIRVAGHRPFVRVVSGLSGHKMRWDTGGHSPNVRPLSGVSGCQKRIKNEQKKTVVNSGAA